MSTLTLRRWHDPFAGFDTLFRTVGSAANGDVAFRTLGSAVNAGDVAFRPAAEIVRDGEDAVVRLELPGLNAEKDIAVEVERGALVVSGERRDERSEDGENDRLREVRYGAFRRTFRLPRHVTDTDLQASYDAGVLTVRVAGAYTGSTPVRIPVGAGAIEAEPAAEAA